MLFFFGSNSWSRGTNHVNEQPPQYWAKKFANYRFDQFDVIRPLIWQEDDIAWWYKQNTFYTFIQMQTSELN